jgi:hypothetical protein
MVEAWKWSAKGDPPTLREEARLPFMRLRLETALPVIAALVASGSALGCGKARAALSAAPPLRRSEVQVCRGFNDKLLEGVTVDPAKGRADYLELREEPSWVPGEGVPDAGDPRAATSPTVLGRFGTACATATDKPACQAALQKIRSNRGFVSHVTGSGMAPTTIGTYLVANFGDRFEVATTEVELRRLIAPVDTTSDVELVGGCGRMLKTNAGWELTKLFTDPGECWGGTSGWQRFTVSADGVVTLKEDHAVTRAPTCISGRRPDGLVASTPEEGQSSLAAFFAQSAYLEAASVVAFERLADELTKHGAPTELIARARRSRDDEARHAHVMEGFVTRLGSTPLPLEVSPLPPRSLFAMALENAVEGCIRETYGALVAHYQASAAESAELRDAMRSIAEDETSHASLSWDVADWVEPLLSQAEREQLARARVDALHELAVSLQRDPTDEALRAAGVPGPLEADQLLSALTSALAPALATARAA